MRSLPGEFERITAIALFLYDLPLDHFAKIPARLRAVTPEQIARASRDYMAPDKMQILLVGDAAVIESQIKTVNAGEIVVIR